MYCSNCGKELNESDKFCSECACPVICNNTQNNQYDNYRQNSSYQPYNNYQPYIKTPTQTLADRERASAIVWTVVACLQALIAVSASGLSMWLESFLDINLPLIGLIPIAVAAWNGYGAYCSFQRVKRVQCRQRGIVREYDNLLMISIIFIIVNVFLGGVIGIAGAVFDLFNRKYALENARFLED